MKNYISLLLLVFSLRLSVNAKIITDTLSFNFEEKTFSGILDLPTNKKPVALIVLIPGSGKTNIVSGNWKSSLRKRFVEEGFACFLWDKAGCGKSEGVFNPNQPVQNSAQEAIAAIEELKRKNIPGSEQIGLWGHSRAGWICPLIIADYPSVAFWISVSGPDDKETYGYLLEKNFRIEGRSKKETKRLMNEWQNGFDIARRGGSFEESLKATETLRNDPFYILMSNNSKPTAEGYLTWQKKFATGENVVDEKSGLLVYIPEFKNVLKKINCPVLAIFGEKDTQVDWQRTKHLYKKTIGKNPQATLAIKIFPDGNHNIYQCKTGGVKEKLEKREFCKDYHETMLVWLRNLSLAN